MRKVSKLIMASMAAMLMLICALAFAACDGGNTGDDTDSGPFSVTIEYAADYAAEQGSISVMSTAGALESGAAVEKDTVLVIAVTAGSGYSIESFTIGGVNKKSELEGTNTNAAMSYTVTGNTVIKAVFSADTSAAVTIPDNLFTEAIGGENPHVVLTEDTGTVISENAIAAIKQSEKPVQIELPSGLVITIDPATITEDAKSLDLNIEITTVEAADSSYGVVIPKNSILIAPSASGQFGLAVSFSIPAASLAATGVDSGKLRLWHIASNGTVSEQGTFVIGDDGSATVTIKGASVYVAAEEKPYAIFGNEEWDFGDLSSVLEAFAEGNATLYVENIVWDTMQTVYLTETSILEIGSENWIYLLFKDGEEYHRYDISVKNNEFIDAYKITEEDFADWRVAYTALFPFVLDNTYYDYDHATLTYTMKDEYIAPIGAAMGMSVDGFTLSLEDQKLVASFFYDGDVLIRSTVWDIGTTLYPEIPEIKLPSGFDNAVTLTTDGIAVDNGSTTYFVFSPETSGYYAFELYLSECRAEKAGAWASYRWYDENGYRIVMSGKDDKDGGGIYFSADTTYYIAFSVGCDCKEEHDIIINFGVAEEKDIGEKT